VMCVEVLGASRAGQHRGTLGGGRWKPKFKELQMTKPFSAPRCVPW